MLLHRAVVCSFSLIEEFHCVNILEFIHPIVDRQLGCYQFSTVMNNAAINIHKYIHIYFAECLLVNAFL